MNEFNFCTRSATLEDVANCFLNVGEEIGWGSRKNEWDLHVGPKPDFTEVFILEPEHRMEHIAVFCKLFPSLNQARKNGFSGEIPVGFTDMFRKKKTVRITILNCDGIPSVEELEDENN